MFKNVTSLIKVYKNEKTIGKKKPKSINKFNIKKEKLLSRYLPLKYISTQIIKNNQNLLFNKELNKNNEIKSGMKLLLSLRRRTKIEIDAKKLSLKKITKKEETEEKHFTENTVKINKKKRFSNKDIIIAKEKENEYVKINTINKKVEIKDKNQLSSGAKMESKNEVPLLELNDISSSSSSLSSSIHNYKNINLSGDEDATKISYNLSNDDIEIKGKHFSKKEKAFSINDMKRSLLNQKINKEEDLIIESQTKENNINSFCVTKAGIDDKKEKINQDSYLILEKLFENNLNIFGIFDGHGKNGHLLSSLVSKFLSSYLTNKENYCSKNNNSDSDTESESDDGININKETLNKLFSKEDFIKKVIKELDFRANECNFDLSLSGTTCLLLFILNNNTLVCSNIGDSICCLFSCSNEDRWTHEILSVIHKPDIPSEKERIISNGGVIHPYYDEYGIYEGPDRVYIKGKTYPGLSLSRSIGDLESEKIGIISEPDIIYKKLDSTNKYIVMGSDGLFDVIKPYDIRRIVNPFFIRNDPEGACNALMKTASKNWDKSGYERDDITIIVAFMGKPNQILN
jgi:serine/threonine protein phosphatase PrpC